MTGEHFSADSTMIGNAGEYFVLAELTRRGWTAAQTARNNRAWDILAREGTSSVALRVKTKTAKSDVFRWNARKDGRIFLDMQDKADFVALVDIPEGDEPPSFWFVPTPMIDEWLKNACSHWVSTPGKMGHQRSQSNKIRLFYLGGDPAKNARGFEERLRRYMNAWSSLDEHRSSPRSTE